MLLRFQKFDDFYVSNVNSNSCSDKLKKNFDLVMFSLIFILNNYEDLAIFLRSGIEKKFNNNNVQ